MPADEQNDMESQWKEELLPVTTERGQAQSQSDEQRYEQDYKRFGLQHLFEGAFFQYNYSVKEQRRGNNLIIFLLLA